MSSHGLTEPTTTPLPSPGGARPHLWKNIVAAVICLGASGAFMALSVALPPGSSRGDVGPGMVPGQIAVLGLLASLVYLFEALRGTALKGPESQISVPRVTALVAIFAAAAAGANWLGLSATLGLAAGAATLLFPGKRLILRAVATGIAFAMIAHFVFEKLLQLPLP